MVSCSHPLRKKLNGIHVLMSKTWPWINKTIVTMKLLSIKLMNSSKIIQFHFDKIYYMENKSLIMPCSKWDQTIQRIIVSMTMKHFMLAWINHSLVLNDMTKETIACWRKCPRGRLEKVSLWHPRPIRPQNHLDVHSPSSM